MAYAFHYRCTNGHAVAGPRPVAVCPVCVKGKPCTGELIQVGRRQPQTRRGRQ